MTVPGGKSAVLFEDVASLLEGMCHAEADERKTEGKHEVPDRSAMICSSGEFP